MMRVRSSSERSVHVKADMSSSAFHLGIAIAIIIGMLSLWHHRHHYCVRCLYHMAVLSVLVLLQTL